MRYLKRVAILVVALSVIVLGIALGFRDDTEFSGPTLAYKPQSHAHLDHTAYFNEPFTSGQDVTQACLKCHPEAGEDMLKSEHWNWLGDPVKIPGHDEEMRIGKRNLINNFCISIGGNWPSCTKCHAGYGWENDDFDFSDKNNIDCLICHERTGQYIKGQSGVPKGDVDLLASAQSVGFPKRESCGSCHYYGGGGLGVKHGDLDNSLDNPSADLDVHMGKHGFLCIDCHKTVEHQISGKSFSVSVDHNGGIGCTNCHVGRQHADDRIESHTKAVACQTCHIPNYARRVPTKMYWDWSKAGDDSRPDNVHEYLKIKGEFKYEQSVEPEYAWFNLEADRYIAGDKIDPSRTVNINMPRGDISDPNAKIWPFKIHRAKQPYDTEYNYLLQPVTATEGGYWFDFDWDKAFRMGEATSGLKYSGHFGWVETTMHWPLSHMVAPSDQALECMDCHGQSGRMDFRALGYAGDPMEIGGRK
jgi:octaheme c-type cytochrome (tetrathionate reductase family)